MINYEELEKLGLDTGFSHIAPLKCSTIELLPEVRQMCEANTCGMYGKRWSCPPGCGHKQNFYAMEKLLRETYPDMLAIGAGCCTKCETCTYPDEPCRFPKKAFSSMEAYGMLVTQICKANDMTYYYGPCTIAYTSCYLLE